MKMAKAGVCTEMTWAGLAEMDITLPLPKTCAN